MFMLPGPRGTRNSTRLGGQESGEFLFFIFGFTKLDVTQANVYEASEADPYQPSSPSLLP